MHVTSIKKTHGEGANRVVVWSPKVGILCTEVHGIMSVDMAEFVVAADESVIDGAGYVHGFHNWWAQASYESGVRQVLVRHVLSIRKQVREAHVLAHSPVLVIGINLSNAALGGLLRAHSTKTSFDTALANAMTQRL